jgi:hypothetical protein
MLLVGVIDDALANIPADVGAVVLRYHLTPHVAAVEMEAADVLVDSRQRCFALEEFSARFQDPGPKGRNCRTLR